jgi:hypothetical protein
LWFACGVCAVCAVLGTRRSRSARSASRSSRRTPARRHGGQRLSVTRRCEGAPA